MSFTFPIDSNNKAGAVIPHGTNGFAVPTQELGYLGLTVKRDTLVANTEKIQDHVTQFNQCMVMNMGTTDIYIAFDATATVGGATSVLIPAGYNITIPVKAQTVHIISTGTPVVQTMGVR